MSDISRNPIQNTLCLKTYISYWFQLQNVTFWWYIHQKDSIGLHISLVLDKKNDDPG